MLNSNQLLGCPSLQGVRLKFTDFNIVAFYWSPNKLLAEELEAAAKVLEVNNEDTTFWIGDLNFSAAQIKI